MSRNYKFHNPDRLIQGWFSEQKIIYTATQQIMPVKKGILEIVIVVK